VLVVDALPGDLKTGECGKFVVDHHWFDAVLTGGLFGMA
jgi:predicted N-acyltransferase